MKIAIFIEPNYKLNINILYWKKIIKKDIGNQIYLNHPPHLTLFTLNIKKLTCTNFLNIKKLIGQYKSFKIKIKEASSFTNDPITKGQTLHYSLNKNIKLQVLQKKLLHLFKDFRLAGLKKNDLKGVMKTNYKKYGYPFCGKNWVPHFTIASIKKNKNNKIINSFIKKKINLDFTVKKVSLWRIKGERHRKLRSFNLL